MAEAPAPKFVIWGATIWPLIPIFPFLILPPLQWAGITLAEPLKQLLALWAFFLILTPIGAIWSGIGVYFAMHKRRLGQMGDLPVWINIGGVTVWLALGFAMWTGIIPVHF